MNAGVPVGDRSEAGTLLKDDRLWKMKLKQKTKGLVIIVENISWGEKHWDFER